MPDLSAEEEDKFHKLGLLLKTDTLRSLREKIGLTRKAMAREMGMEELQYIKAEEKERQPTYHLKAALNVMRILYWARIDYGE